jgi:hypothetical protein
MDEPVPEPMEESVPEPVDEPVPEPVEESVPEPVDEPVPEPVEESVPEPMEESVPEPVEESVEEIIPKIIFIIPYRDRERQRTVFDNHMRNVILADKPEGYYKLLYINQNDNKTFNRGAMKNIGFISVKNTYPNDYQNITLVFNDVDTLPNNSNTIPSFETVPGIVKHFFGLPGLLGGIFSINAQSFEKINGFPNYWSWGYEDNMIFQRAKSAGMMFDYSTFYKIGDTENIHQGQNGKYRIVNRTEFERYAKNNNEGINSITNLHMIPDYTIGFVNVLGYNTGYTHNPQTDMTYDISKGNRPFKVGYSALRRSKINMVSM